MGLTHAEASTTEEPDAAISHVRGWVGGVGKPAFLPRPRKKITNNRIVKGATECLNSKDTKDADIRKAIQLAEQSVCAVWQMIKNNVEVVPEYKFIWRPH